MGDKHTRLTQTVQNINAKNTVTTVTYMTRPIDRTIQTLKAKLPFPNKFFMELERKNKATFEDSWGATITIELTEVEPNEGKNEKSVQAESSHKVHISYQRKG